MKRHRAPSPTAGFHQRRRAGASPRVLTPLLLLVALVLAGCSANTATSSAGASATGSASSAPITIKVGYINNPSILPILIAKDQGFFKAQNITIEEVPFDNGADVGAALAGGSLNVGYVGGAMPVFASRGAGMVFDVALLEKDTVKIYGDPSVKDLADIKGKMVATTVGTTAHVTLYYALKSVGLGLNDIKLVNADQASAVNAFVSKRVDAAAVFPPNTIALEAKRPDAKVLAKAGDFYPENSVYVGFVANNAFTKDRRADLVRFSTAMIKANDYLINHKTEARAAAYQAYFKGKVDETAYNAILDGFTPQPSQDWVTQFADGTAVKSLTRLENVFVTIGGLTTFVPPEKWFDPSIYTDALKKANSSQ